MTWQLHRARDPSVEAVITIDTRTKLVVRPANLSAVWMLYSGLHEYHELQFCLRYLRKGDHFLDVGANVGVYTALIGSRLPAVKLTAIEPFPPALEMLYRNCAVNDISPDVRPIAVSAATGDATLTITARDVHNRLAHGPASPAKGLRVPVMSLDDIIGDDPVRLIKIDVEGGEHDVLRGARHLLSRADPPVLLFELAGHEATYGSTPEDIVALLTSHGYRTYLMDGALTPYRGVGRPATNNILATTDIDSVRARLKSNEGAACATPVAVTVDYSAARP